MGYSLPGAVQRNGHAAAEAVLHFLHFRKKDTVSRSLVCSPGRVWHWMMNSWKKNDGHLEPLVNSRCLMLDPFLRSSPIMICLFHSFSSFDKALGSSRALPYTPPDVDVAMKRGGKPASSSEPFDDKDDFEKGQDEESPLLEFSKPPPKPSPSLGFRDGFGLGSYIQRLESSFGSELLIMLFVSQHLMKGFVNEFIAPCIAYLYGSYKVPGPQMQIYRGVTQLPWAMKPMIGLLSDAVPIFGYNKSPYILLVAVLGTAAMTTIGLVPRASLSITSLVLCLFLIQLQLSTTDLLTEAKYAEKMQTKPKEGPALMSYVWFGLQMGGLCATLLTLSSL